MDDSYILTGDEWEFITPISDKLKRIRILEVFNDVVTAVETTTGVESTFPKKQILNSCTLKDRLTAYVHPLYGES